MAARSAAHRRRRREAPPRPTVRKSLSAEGAIVELARRVQSTSQQKHESWLHGKDKLGSTATTRRVQESDNFSKKSLPKRMLRTSGPEVMQMRSLRTPSNLKKMIPPRREHSFHISTCRPKVLENNVPSQPLGLPLAPQIGPKSPKGPFRNTLKFQCDFDCIQGLKMIPKWPSNQAGFFDKNYFFRGFPAHCSPNGPQRARSTL